MSQSIRAQQFNILVMYYSELADLKSRDRTASSILCTCLLVLSADIL